MQDLLHCPFLLHLGFGTNITTGFTTTRYNHMTVYKAELSDYWITKQYDCHITISYIINFMTLMVIFTECCMADKYSYSHPSNPFL